MSQTANVVSQCSVSKISDIQFGIFDFTNFPVSAFNRSNYTDFPKNSGSVSVSCTKGTYNLYIDYGRRPDRNSWTAEEGSMCLRKMIRAEDDYYLLAYQIYQDSGYTQWPRSSVSDCGNPNKTVLFKQIVFSSTPNTIETVPIYGKIMWVANYLPFGHYSDTLTISVVF